MEKGGVKGETAEGLKREERGNGDQETGTRTATSEGCSLRVRSRSECKGGKTARQGKRGERETREGEVRKVPCSFRGWRSGNNTTLLR
jgi:hypothetical protein